MYREECAWLGDTRDLEWRQEFMLLFSIRLSFSAVSHSLKKDAEKYSFSEAIIQETRDFQDIMASCKFYGKWTRLA